MFKEVSQDVSRNRLWKIFKVLSKVKQDSYYKLELKGE